MFLNIVCLLFWSILLRSSFVLGDDYTPPPACENPSAIDLSGCGAAGESVCNETSRCFMFHAADGYTLDPAYMKGSGTPNDWMQQCKCACGDRAALDPAETAKSLGCFGTKPPMPAQEGI